MHIWTIMAPQQTDGRTITCHRYRAYCLGAGLAVLILDPSSLRSSEHVPEIRPYCSDFSNKRIIQVTAKDKAYSRLHVKPELTIQEDRSVDIT